MFRGIMKRYNIKICLKKKKNGQIPLGRGIPLYSSSGPNRGLRG